MLMKVAFEKHLKLVETNLNRGLELPLSSQFLGKEEGLKVELYWQWVVSWSYLYWCEIRVSGTSESFGWWIFEDVGKNGKSREVIVFEPLYCISVFNFFLYTNL